MSKSFVFFKINCFLCIYKILREQPINLLINTMKKELKKSWYSDQAHLKSAKPENSTIQARRH